MTRKERKTCIRAARLLEAQAKMIADSGRISAKGHPRFGQWPDGPYGEADKADHDQLIKSAQELRAIAARSQESGAV